MLHIISNSPYASSSLENCLRYATKQCTILLIEDAVIAGLEKGQWFSRLISSGHLIYLLNDDVIARGLQNQVSSQFNLVDMAGFVWLTELNTQNVKW